MTQPNNGPRHIPSDYVAPEDVHIPAGYFAPPNPSPQPQPPQPQPQESLAGPLYGAGPVQAFKRFFIKYASFAGRASLSEYWWSRLFLGAGLVAFMFLAQLGADRQSDELSAFGSFVMFIFVICFLGIIVPNLAISFRRLHDANLSGWFILLSFLPLVGPVTLLVFTLLPSKAQGARFDKAPAPQLPYGPGGY
ncbi:DUF805 domain-containing protein [Specibacter sp. NPDC057265]|uniref:DUF805 domain-containing protein n=1 Tax=Specibacter sp. NPDC057265 TaxID=3346075 RepID=UPI0036269629